MKPLAVLILILSFTSAWAATKNESALELENSYLNIAKLLSVEHDKNGPCGDIEAYSFEIVIATRNARNHFDTNWDWNKDTGRKFKIDPIVTKTLANTLALKDIMNMLDYNDPSTYEHALNRVVMWGPAPGVYGNMSSLTFMTNNKVKLGQLELLDNFPYYEWIYEEGSFLVRKISAGMLIEIDIDGQIDTYRLMQDYKPSKMWYMVPANDPATSPYTDGFVDYPSECDA